MERLEHYLNGNYLTVPAVIKINKQMFASHYENKT